MADESHSFSTARTRLEDIVSQVRKKDTSLEKSLDLLEEGVRLANACTELIDRQDWTSGVTPTDAEPAAETVDSAESATESREGAEDGAEDVGAGAVQTGGAVAVDDVAVTGEVRAPATGSDEVPRFDPAPEFFDADDVWADESEPAAGQESDDPSMSEG